MEIKRKMLKLNLGGTIVNDVVCINLKKRKDRKVSIKRQARKKNFPVRIFRAIEHSKPNIGKFRSHLKCIEEARKKRCKSILIFEDDAKVLTSRLSIPPPPLKWDMLYLGGNIQSVMQDDDTDSSRVWKRACVSLSHCYVINRSAFDLVIDAGHKAIKENSDVNIDEWYCNVIHPQLHVYAAIPERVIQKDGYSDVKKREITYRQQLTRGTGEGEAPNQLAVPVQEEVVNEDGTKFMKIKMPAAPAEEDLPSIALVTCVHNQLDLFQILQWSYYMIDYPRDKLTWIIVDDSPDEDKVAPLIPGEDKSIKYVRCAMESSSEFLAISRKLNIAMTHAPPNMKYMLHFSPDCYYGPGSVRTRVRLMLANPEYGCFGCTKYGVYDLNKEESWEQHGVDGRGNATMIFGPSLSYTKEWWQEQSFDDTRYTLETFYFLRGRWDRVLDIPYGLVLLALTWNGHQPGEASRYSLKGKATTTNGIASRNNDTGRTLTDKESKIKRTNKDGENFSDDWNLTTKNMMLMLGSLLGTSEENED